MQMALWIGLPFINAILLHKNVLLTVEIDKYLWKSSNECDNLPVDIRNNWGGDTYNSKKKRNLICQKKN